VANTREKHKLSRFGCIAWLGDSLIAELLVHGKASEVSATALDALLELEAVAVEERRAARVVTFGVPTAFNADSTRW
jgi:hypothetical protein